MGVLIRCREGCRCVDEREKNVVMEENGVGSLVNEEKVWLCLLNGGKRCRILIKGKRCSFVY